MRMLEAPRVSRARRSAVAAPLELVRGARVWANRAAPRCLEMTALGRYEPIVAAPFEGVCHRTAAFKATRRERRAPEAGR